MGSLSAEAELNIALWRETWVLMAKNPKIKQKKMSEDNLTGQTGRLVFFFKDISPFFHLSVLVLE